MNDEKLITDPVVIIMVEAIKIVQKQRGFVDMNIRCAASEKGMLPIIQIEFPEYDSTVYIHKDEADTSEILAEKMVKKIDALLARKYSDRYSEDELFEDLRKQEQNIKERFTLKGKIAHRCKRLLKRFLRWRND